MATFLRNFLCNNEIVRMTNDVSEKNKIFAPDSQ